MQDNSSTTFEQFSSILDSMVNTWLPRLSKLNGSDVLFCGYTADAWVILLDEHSHRVKHAFNIYKTRRYSIITFSKFTLEADFLEWCSEQNALFEIGDNASCVLEFLRVDWSKVSNNIIFTNASGTLFFINNDLTKIQDYSIFSFENTDKITLLHCTLSGDFFNNISANIMDFSWCTNWSNLDELNVKNMKIIYDTIDEVPNTFDFLPFSLSYFGLIGMNTSYNPSKNVVPVGILYDLFRRLKVIKVRVQCTVNDNFQPLRLFNIQRLSELFIQFDEAGKSLCDATDIVQQAINERPTDKTSALLACQETLIEQGLSKYARL